MKEWVSPIYAFFYPMPKIVEEDGRRAQVFKCSRRGCQTLIRRYLDTKDARSSSNLRKHACKCWGDEVVTASDQANNADDACTNILAPFLQNGSITTSFKNIKKGKVTYSAMPHTPAQTRCNISVSRVSLLMHLFSELKLFAGWQRTCSHSI